MVRIPATCNNCGRLFPSGFEVGGTGVAQMVNCTAGPCPYCGALGNISDGIYSALTRTALLLVSGNILPPHFRELISILNSTIEKKTDYQSVSNQIKEKLPELSSVADVLPKTRNELYAFIALLIALVTLILNSCKSETSPPSVTNVNLIVNQAIERSYKKKATQKDVQAKDIKQKSDANRKLKKTKILKKKKRKMVTQSKRKNR